MKIFIICSKKFYDRIPEFKTLLEENGHVVTLPNSYDDPDAESRYRDSGKAKHAKWKSGMLKHSTDIIDTMDAVLVLNFEKNGIPNYIGGATFLEMYDAFRLDKRIFMINDIPEGILKDEIVGFDPIVISGDLSKIML